MTLSLGVSGVGGAVKTGVKGASGGVLAERLAEKSQAAKDALTEMLSEEVVEDNKDSAVKSILKGKATDLDEATSETFTNFFKMQLEAEVQLDYLRSQLTERPDERQYAKSVKSNTRYSRQKDKSPTVDIPYTYTATSTCDGENYMEWAETTDSQAAVIERLRTKRSVEGND